ncbi:putative GPI-GlcNAc transferase complex, PIG-H component domain-containing protein [Lupinus albus]|uniref:Putative GPI-GlcNAc transferase complex, PIG-H component domain-containing protein n=1 Tax=Lupinus albus TaxID=3870 RepID=A0A6A4P2H5_LUPAL|nr:putative GPI-GlcNAc transferase complex, PIG-H component domain-containing protein [Lupinus albus]
MECKCMKNFWIYLFCFGFRMVKFSISNARYIYVHDQKYPSEDVDIHHIVSRKSISKSLFVYTLAFLVLACSIHLYVVEEKSISLVYYCLFFDIFLVKLLLGKNVKKESVVIMPAFGVQLETHSMSGKVIRCFVPIDKILRPVLVECITPMTCYWNLSLIVRGESEMVLVFKKLRPPVKMLVHVWKALCAETDSKEGACTHAE